MFNVLGIVDDNPGLVEELPDDYKGTVFLYDTDEVFERDFNVISCADWDTVTREVERRFKN